MNNESELYERSSRQVSRPNIKSGSEFEAYPAVGDSRRQLELVPYPAPSFNDREKYEHGWGGHNRRDTEIENDEARLERLRMWDTTKEASKGRHGSLHVPGVFQTVFDVNHPQDASIHLELPITDDYESELEVFSRLQRLGNFSAVEDYFQNNWSHIWVMAMSSSNTAKCC